MNSSDQSADPRAGRRPPLALMGEARLKRGAISWMARNPVAANLLAAVLLFGGLVVGLNIQQEVFPELEIDAILISVPYPGASPEEVEQGVVLAVEEAIRGLDGVERVSATAMEGRGVVTVELIHGSDRDRVLADVKNAIDRITSFPLDAERPIVNLASNRREVISIVIYGDAEEHALRAFADRAREDLLRHPQITTVELDGVRPLQVNVEVPQETLRRHGLTLDRVAQTIRAAAVELPGGGVKTPGGEVLLRTAERRDHAEDFRSLPIVTTPDGTRLELSDLAHVEDGFADTDVSAYFDGLPAAMVNVFRVGSETPLEVAEAVKQYVAETAPTLPPGIRIAVWRDWSEIFRGRMDLLLRNAYLGLGLVLLILGLFLELRLAFWVTLGIPISFLGALLFMPATDMSINMMSMFAFIVTLGMVVDDAIVVGENVYHLRARGIRGLRAAILGAREMASPVTFAILTSVAAFMPMLFVPGFVGRLFGVIPVVVILVLLMSLVECLFILPAHLAHIKDPNKTGFLAFMHRRQQRISRGIAWLIRKAYTPVLKVALDNRYLTVSFAVALLLFAFGLVAGGRVNRSFMPRVDSDIVRASAVLPFGAPVEASEAVRDELIARARETIARHGGDPILRGIFSQIGSPSGRGGAVSGASRPGGSHLVSVMVFMVPTAEREVTAITFARDWREAVGIIPGLQSLGFRYTAGASPGADIDVQVSHTDLNTLEQVAGKVAAQLATYSGVRDIDDGVERGKEQLDFRVHPQAAAAGFTATDLGRQVRAAFFGAEALRQQRGRDEIRVMVRLPEAERHSEHDVESLIVRTASGLELPLPAAAEITRGRSYTSIRRVEGRRTINVTADVLDGVGNPIQIREDLEQRVLPDFARRFPGAGFSFEGQQRELSRAMGHLGRGYLVALLVIYALLAVPFKSYVQPLVVMAAIPFGFIGALFGHLLMGYSMSLISAMGIIALSGVVVNDSLILIDAANRQRRQQGDTPFEAILSAGVRRFRPILLTSLTTFGGLAPMIFETSVQARFLIPMAISLGFGILFATFIILMLVPSLYLIAEDLRCLLGFRDPMDRAAENEASLDQGEKHDSPPQVVLEKHS